MTTAAAPPKKTRTDIPSQIRASVLKEWSHACALCRNRDPELHHIDEEPSNNEPMNLIPLCGTCHQQGQHHPGRRIEPGILRLYREHKLDAILNPRFRGLFAKLRFLDENDDMTLEELYEARDDLVGFVGAMEMGDFYGPKLKRMLPGNYASVINLDSAEDFRRQRRVMADDFRASLAKEVARIRGNVMEAVSVQSWPRPSFREQ